MTAKSLELQKLIEGFDGADRFTLELKELVEELNNIGFNLVLDVPPELNTLTDAQRHHVAAMLGTAGSAACHHFATAACGAYLRHLMK